ncbi:stage III sporulation protein AG [Gracilibacillus halophilus]|nr:stage III sporulation protein AG [Gracilibacillus halophilus]
MKRIKNAVKPPDTKNHKLHYIALVALIGLFLLIVGNLFDSEEEPSTTPDTPIISEESEETKDDVWQQDQSSESTSNLSDIEKVYEKDLTVLLEKMSGVSEADVMVNLDATGEKVYEKNLVIGSQITNETDQNGGNRKIDDETREQTVVVIRQGDNEVPLLIQKKKPQVRGVLVVAKGVDNLEIKEWVLDAVTKVLDVGAHRVSIMPKNSDE